MEIQILKDDPAYPFLDILQHRREKGLDVITIADTFHNLLSALHKTSTQNRPLLNGNSRKIVIEHLGITKGMLSQYMTISKNIKSPKVKQEIKNHRIWLIDAYYLSKVRGKNQEETEKVQLQKIDEIIQYRRKNDISKLMQFSKGKANESLDHTVKAPSLTGGNATTTNCGNSNNSGEPQSRAYGLNFHSPRSTDLYNNG